MQNLQISFVLSIWPMHWTAGHDFDGEQHKWWAAVGPVGITIISSRYLGHDPWTIGKWERGEQTPLLTRFTDWCAALGVTINLSE